MPPFPAHPDPHIAAPGLNGYAPGPNGYPLPPQYARDPRYAMQGEVPEPVSFISAFTMSLIGMVPVVGLVYLLLQAMQSPGQPNRRTFARGLLTARLIVLLVVVVVLVFLFVSAMMRRIFYLS